jgi:hypothetical protein
MQNITELRQSLADNYEQMKAKKMELKTGKELANTAGKLINTIKVELEYNQMTGSKNKIDFLEPK